MLNRLYIVIGFLAIFMLMGAFIAPHLMNWSGYRERVQAIASEALGTKVQIFGAIEFSLLPRPRMSFEDIKVGSDEMILTEISSIVAELSLMDFLRDRYYVKSLVLQSPKLFVHINSEGDVVTPLKIPKSISASNINIADAKIVNGLVEIIDARSDSSFTLSEFEGNLNLGGLRGPFALKGDFEFRAKKYHVQLTSSDLNASDEMNLSANLRPLDSGFSMRLAGLLKAGKQLNFNGALEYRQKPPLQTNELGISGDRLLNSKIEISSDKILMPEYVFLPDENRPATRLSGAMEIALGESPFYNAIISGGVVDIISTDNSLNKPDEFNELLDLFDEIKAPLLPPIDGVVGVDISELIVKGMPLRNVRIDAYSNNKGWLIKKFEAQLSGKTTLAFNGVYNDENGLPFFDGQLEIISPRLDILSNSWQGNKTKNALFNMAGSLDGNISFLNGKLSLLGGNFIFDGVENPISFGIDKVDNEYSLDIFAELGEYNSLQSKAIGELIPNRLISHSFVDVFSKGSFNLLTKKLTIFDLPVINLGMEGRWNEREISFKKLNVLDYGGVNFDLSGGYNSTSKNPVVFGKGIVKIKPQAQKQALANLFENFSLTKQFQDYLSGSLPAEFSVTLEKPYHINQQIFELTGKAGVADVNLKLNMIDGAIGFINSPLEALLELKSNDVEALGAQLGLGDLALVPQNSQMIVSLGLAGSIFNSIDIDLSLSGGDEMSMFLGNIFLSNASTWNGKGRLEINTSDLSPFLELMGVENIGAVPLLGEANLSFTGFNNIKLEEIKALANGANITGKLSRNISNGKVFIDGDLTADNMELLGLTKLFGGSSSVLMGEEIWPQGPFAFSQSDKKSSGRVHVSSPSLLHKDKEIAQDIGFDFIWDENNIRLRSFEAKIGAGKIDLDVSLCCNGIIAERQMNGRVSLSGVDLALLLPKNVSNIIGGNANAGISFTGSGDSFAGIFDSLAGEGSFNISNLKVDKFSMQALAALTGLENILEIDEDELKRIIIKALKGGAFNGDEIAGVLNIAGGNLRIANVGSISKNIDNQSAELFGSFQLDLADLGIGGNWRLTPLANNTHNGAIIVELSGSLLSPIVNLNVGQLIEAARLKALESELDRLEKLQKEALERSKAAALERAALMEAARIEKEEAEAAALAEQKAKEEAEKLAQQKAIEKLQEQEITINNDMEDSITNLPIELLPEVFVAPVPSFQ